ncbi:GTP-binding protein ryH1, putative [Entamoeba invadens IP1]|uniref:GTP-binding protein ryH1, putative n=1 Tax=Entamoeba invadens IP1 TaxID=370355 RepID=A0A0A1UB36_ENTIV|nr:GTP-binding protein ryH1, putative [Entamoeba invadens IP1]ELP92315.1 GTP-binding protein ryH1, putative [Entamoeba invadens IP1]|eukprot:XP_004259086.1 GTP-binding protein ryH1, putative [Entamoeba invadens IP1]
MAAMMKHKIVFLGDSSVGKTCIIGRFMTGDFNNGYESLVCKNGKTIQLQIWDTAGQERYRSLIPSYIRDSAAAVVVYDVNDRQTFENVSRWVKDLKELEKGNIFVYLVGNKIDMETREVQQKEALAKGEELHCNCFETSAKTNINISELFASIAENLCTLPIPADEHVEVVNVNKNSGNTSTCC